jgi:hypothetical protein
MKMRDFCLRIPRQTSTSGNFVTVEDGSAFIPSFVRRYDINFINSVDFVADEDTVDEWMLRSVGTGRPRGSHVEKDACIISSNQP